jgi:hypothetical protein
MTPPLKMYPKPAQHAEGTSKRGGPSLITPPSKNAHTELISYSSQTNSTTTNPNSLTVKLVSSPITNPKFPQPPNRDLKYRTYLTNRIIS